MSSPGEDPKHRALAREWAAARIVVIGGLILACAVGGYFAWRSISAQNAQQQAAQPAPAPRKIDAKTLRKVEIAVCSIEIKRAEDIGIVPIYAGLGSPNLVRSNVPHRFICEAKTHLTHYFIAADLLCDKLSDPRCVSVYRVMLPNGTLLYSRLD